MRNIIMISIVSWFTFGCGGGGRAILTKLDTSAAKMEKLEGKLDTANDKLKDEAVAIQRLEQRVYYIQSMCSKTEPIPPPAP